MSCNPKKQKNVAIAEPEISLIEKDDGYSLRCKMLNIDNLKAIPRYHQIRIWVELYSVSDTGNIVVLKKENDLWKASFHEYRFNAIMENENVLESHIVSNGEPFSGWDKFLGEIQELGIYELNDVDRKKNFGLCNDGGTIIIEIAKDEKYYEYIYPCWIDIKDQTQINKIYSILREIKQEFNFNISVKSSYNL